MSRSLPVTVADSSDAEAGAMGTTNPFDSKVIRMGFIRKVYAILSLQLIVTSVIISIFILIPELTEFAKSPKGQILIGATSIPSMIIILVLVCCQNIARSHPTNMILLSVFTVLTGVSLAGTCVRYERDEVMVAAAITTAVFVFLTMFAMQTTIDFTIFTGLALVMLLLLLVFGIVVAIFPSRALFMVYSCVGAALFSFYVIIDTQLIVGGRNRKYSLSPEDYIMAVLSLYLDAINLFLFILRITRGSRS